jgi:hypothetical protein
MTDQNYECCPPFDPTEWDNKEFEWSGKKFIKDRVRTFWYMPLNFGSVMRRLDEKVRTANATIPDSLCLADHTSKWNMDVYLAVDRDIPNAQNVTLDGSFVSKVYEGPFQNTGKWCADFETAVKEKGKKIKTWYMWYTTCPKCAKKYGRNYVAIFGRIA